MKASTQLATFHGDVDPRGQKQAPEAVVEDLVALQRGCGVVSDFNTWRREKKKSLSSAPVGDVNGEVICAHVELILRKANLQRSRQKCGSCVVSGGCWC